MVDFYAKLFHALSRYAHEYHPYTRYNRRTHSNDTFARREHLFRDLSNLFQASCTITPTDNKGMDANIEEETIVAYAVPTFQAPMGFFHKELSFPSDCIVIRNWLNTAIQQNPSSTIRLSSAYLNPTSELLSVFKKFGFDPTQKLNRSSFGKVILLTAGATSHGFAPKRNKRGLGKDRSWIPLVFHHIMADVASHIIPRGGNIILYERPGWTFHSKGLWLTKGENHDMNLSSPSVHIAKPESTLVGTVVGSGNFGFRSEKLDFESNALLVMNPYIRPHERMKTAHMLAQDWNDLCRCNVTPFQSMTNPAKNIPEFSSSSYYKHIVQRLGLRALIRVGKIFF